MDIRWTGEHITGSTGDDCGCIATLIFWLVVWVFCPVREDAGAGAASEVISGGQGSNEGVDDDAVDTGLQRVRKLLSPTEPSSRGATLSVIRDNAPVPTKTCGIGWVADLGA